MAFLNKNKKSYQKGFGLVEVLVSLSILTITVMGFNYLGRQAFYNWESAQNRSIAYNIIQDTFEEFRNTRDTNIASPEPGRSWFDGIESVQKEGLTEYANFSREVVIEDIPVRVDYNGGEIDLDESKKRLTIEVFWTGRRGEKSLKSVTYLTNWRSSF